MKVFETDSEGGSCLEFTRISGQSLEYFECLKKITAKLGEVESSLRTTEE